MHRRILLASAGVMALAGTAFAADLPAAPPPPPPPPMWTGFYAGVNAGYDWAASRNVTTTAIPGFAAPTFGTELALSSALATGTNSVSPNGFIGGGQIGYNYQLNPNWVVGLEADMQGIASSNSASSFAGAGVPVGFPGETITSAVTSSKQLDYLGTVRVRFGYLLMPTFLIYGTGGLAYGGVQTTTSILQNNTGLGTGPFGSFGRISNTEVGWTAGGGFEWMFLPNWSAKVEYLYYDLGTATNGLGLLSNPGLYTSSASSTTRFNGSLVRAGIDYHFYWGAPAPVVAKY